MRGLARATTWTAAVLLLSLAVTGVVAWWVAVASVYAGSALSSLLGALRRPDDPTGVRLSSRRARRQQAVLRAAGWTVATTAAFGAHLPVWAVVPLVAVIAAERGYAGARNSDVLLHDDRLVTESESLFPEELPVAQVVGVELEATVWSDTRRLVVVSNPARRTPLLPCLEGSDDALRALAWARERGIAVPSVDDGVAPGA